MPLKIDLHYQSDPPFNAHTHEMVGIGGTENFITYSSEYLARQGHEVTVYNRLTTAETSHHGGVSVTWRPLSEFKRDDERDVLISFRFRDVFDQSLPNTGLRVIMLADTESHGLGAQVKAGRLDLVGFVSKWQKDKIQAEEEIPEKNALLTSNGVAVALFNRDRKTVKRVRGKCIHLATPERGASYLLNMWEDIQARVPHASLHLFSSFFGWGVTEVDNESMSQALYEQILGLQAQGLNIVNHKHAGAGEIRRHLLESEAYLYPTRHFDETCCISAIEAAAAGMPIVATCRAALAERVRPYETGYLIPDCKGHDHEFMAAVIRTLLNPPVWKKTSEKARLFAQGFDYGVITSKWVKVFEQHLNITEAPECEAAL
jgi:glycosyltransferase involved in cell wall biosynthesis